MLISQDRSEAGCCLNEGERARVVEKLSPLYAHWLQSSPQSLFLGYLCIIAVSSAADYCAKLGATSLQEPPTRRQTGWRASAGAPLIHLWLHKVQCTWTQRCRHSLAYTRAQQCAIHSWLCARCGLLPTARGVCSWVEIAEARGAF